MKAGRRKEGIDVGGMYKRISVGIKRRRAGEKGLKGDRNSREESVSVVQDEKGIIKFYTV